MFSKGKGIASARAVAGPLAGFQRRAVANDGEAGDDTIAENHVRRNAPTKTEGVAAAAETPAPSTPP